MNSVLVATVAGIMTALAWGTGDWLTGKSSKRYDKFEFNLGVQLPGALIMLPILIFSHLPLPSTRQMLAILLAGTLITSAYLLFMKAMSSGSIGVVVVLGNSYAVVTLILSTIFIGGVFTGNQILAMLAIMLGGVLLAYEKNHKKIPLKVLYRETFFAVCAALVWGTAFFIVNTMVGKVSWQMLTGLSSIFIVPYGAALVLLSQKSELLPALKRSVTNKTALITGVIFQTGALAFYIGSDRAGSVLIPAVIASGCPLVTSVLAAVVDKERIGLIKRIGAVIVIGGIVALNLI